MFIFMFQLSVAHCGSVSGQKINLAFLPKPPPQKVETFLISRALQYRKLTGYFHFLKFVHKNSEKVHSWRHKRSQTERQT